MTMLSFILILETFCISSYTWNTPLMKITAPWARFHQMSFPKMKELETKNLEKFNNWTAHGPSMHGKKTKELFGFRGKTQQNSGCWENILREPSSSLSMRDWKPYLCLEFISSIVRGGKGKRYQIHIQPTSPTTTDTAAEIPQGPSRLTGWKKHIPGKQLAPWNSESNTPL